MNAVEIEEAVSTLVDEPLDAAEFLFAFLQASGNKETMLRKLRRMRGGSITDRRYDPAEGSLRPIA